MSNRLEQFVKDNREEFDKFEPGPVAWHNIQQELKKPAPKAGLVISMKALKWSAAAAVIILVATGAYFFGKNNGEKKDIAATPINKTEETVPKKENDSPLLTKENPQEQLAATEGNKTQKDEPTLASADDSYDEEMYHYTRLVELKQKQITAIKKDEPLLYQKFAGDINKLDSAFHTLKKQLPVNPNREQILEAMIENLKLQEAVLNQQLDIIKQINQAKKSEYEKAYKSI